MAILREWLIGGACRNTFEVRCPREVDGFAGSGKVALANHAETQSLTEALKFVFERRHEVLFLETDYVDLVRALESTDQIQ